MAPRSREPKTGAQTSHQSLCLVSSFWENNLFPFKCCQRVGPVQGSKSPKSGKEGFGDQKLPFPNASEKGDLSQKAPFSLWSPVEIRGFFDSNRPFLTHWEMGVFGPKPSFPDFGDFDPCTGPTRSQFK